MAEAEEEGAEFYTDAISGRLRRRRVPSAARRGKKQRDAKGRPQQGNYQRLVHSEYALILSLLAKKPDHDAEDKFREIWEILLSVRLECSRWVGVAEYEEGAIWDALGYGVEREEVDQVEAQARLLQKNLLMLLLALLARVCRGVKRDPPTPRRVARTLPNFSRQIFGETNSLYWRGELSLKSG